MSKRKIFSLSTLGLATALALSACGGSSAPQDTKVTQVANTSSKHLASMVVTANSGRVVYSGALNCPSGQTCNAAFVAPTLHEPYTYRFSDAAGTLVTAHLDSNSDLNVDDIKTTDVMLGLHLFELLKSSMSLTPIELSHKLDRFFTYYDSPDATPDFFEELGMYYNRQADGAVSESQFLVDIAALLSKDEILPAPPTVAKTRLFSQPRAMVGTAVVEECQPVSAFFKMGGQIRDEFNLLLPGAGLLFSTGGEVLDLACGSSTGDLGASLADITAKLNVMETKLNQLGYKVEGLKTQIDDFRLQTRLVWADQPYQQLNGYVSQYSSLTKGFPSLYDYVQSRGGLTKELYASSTEIQSLFSGLMDQKTLHDQLFNTSNLQEIRSALDFRCQNELLISTDVVATRNGCNLLVLNLMAKVSTTHATGTRMMRDIIKVLNHARQQPMSAANKVWLDELRQPFSTWEAADAQAAAMLGNNMQSLTNIFGQAVISPIKGLDTELTMHMVNARCTRTVDGKTGPALMEWYIQSQNTPDAFIRTQCTSAGKPVNARYYYDKDGTNAVNILGVLAKASWWQASPRNPGVYTRIPAKSEDTGNSNFLDEALWFNNIIPNGVMSVNNARGDSHHRSYIEPGNDHSYDSPLTGSPSDPEYIMFSDAYKTRLKRNDDGPYVMGNYPWGVETTLLSYRHTDGYTYVWQQRYLADPWVKTTVIALHMECITSDCQNHADPKFVKFTNSANKTFKVGWSTVERGVEKLYTEDM